MFFSLLLLLAGIQEASRRVLLFIIFIFNVYFGFFWLREILRQKSAELYKNDILAYICGGCLRRLIKLKKFQYKTEKELELSTKRISQEAPPSMNLDVKVENLEEEDAEFQEEVFIEDSPYINQFKKKVIVS